MRGTLSVGRARRGRVEAFIGVGVACALLLLLPAAANAGTAPSRPSLEGGANPDPAHIVRANAHLIEVTPAGDSQDTQLVHPLAGVPPYADDNTFDTVNQISVGFAWKTATQDVVNVQWAVQNVGSAGTVRLKGGVFHFGSSAVYLPAVSLVGDGLDARGDPRTVIEGGLVPIRVAWLHGGEGIRVDGLWFRGARYMAVNGYHINIARLEVTNNKITQMQLLPAASRLPYRFAVWVEGLEECSVSVIHIQGNRIDNVKDTPQLPPAPLIQPPGNFPFVDDNGVNVQSCAVQGVTITNNVIRNQGEPIELFSNRGATARIVVADNDVAVAGDPTYGADGIAVANNEGASVLVAANRLALRNDLGDSIPVLVSHRTPGSSFQIRDNIVTIDGSAFVAMLVGLPFLDSPLSNALIARNSFSGPANDGIFIDDLAGANQSRNDLFLQNDLSKLVVAGCSVRLGPSTANNHFIHNEGLALTPTCDKGDHNMLVK